MRACREWRVPPTVFASWPDDDQDEIIGFLREENRVCSGCGTHPDEWAQDRYAFVAQSTQCPGCELLDREKEDIPEKARGVKTYLIPRESYEAQQRQRETNGQE